MLWLWNVMAHTVARWMLTQSDEQLVEEAKQLGNDLTIQEKKLLIAKVKRVTKVLEDGLHEQRGST